MAQARRGDAHQDLAAPGRSEIEFDHVQRLRPDVGGRQAWRLENGGSDAHAMSSTFPRIARC